jgi:hypothetical protein
MARGRKQKTLDGFEPMFNINSLDAIVAWN